MYLLLSAVLVLIVIGLMLLSSKQKLSFAHRILHIRSVIITVVFGVVAVFCFVPLLNLLNKLISLGPVRNFLLKVVPQNNTSSAFFWIVTVLSCLAVSLAYLIVIFIVKKLWLEPKSKKPYLESRNPITKLFNLIASICYDTDGSPSVKVKWENVGQWLRVMRNIFSAALIAEAVLLPLYLQLNLTLIDESFLNGIVKSLYMLPVVSWFLLDQIVTFLQSDGKPDSADRETEDIDISHIGEYRKLMEVYESLFGGQALISTYVNETVPGKGLFSGPTAEQKKRVDNPELLEAICRGVNNLADPLTPNFIDALIDLINGKSIAVFDTVSGEFQLFYLAYLQRDLFLRRKALFVCDTEEQVGSFIDQTRTIFAKLNKAHEIWRICDVGFLTEENCKDVDILVCTEEQLLANDIEEKYPGFYNYLHDVFVIHAYDIMCRFNPFAFRFFNALKKKNAQFVFLVPENNCDIADALANRLDNADIELYNDFNEEAGACILCWRAESFYKTQQAISMELNDDFGLAYTVALIALKNGVSKIYMHAPGSVPLTSYAKCVKGYSSTLSKTFFKIDNVDFDSVERNPIVAFRSKDLSFDVIYDEYNNLLNVAMQALTECAKVTSMVHIVSRPYMLRDYFALHLNSMVRNDRGMQLTVPTFSYDLKAASVALLIRLREKGMYTEDVIRYMEGFNVKGKNIKELLELVLSFAFGRKESQPIFRFFSFGPSDETVFRNNNYCRTRFIKLTDENLYKRARKLTENNIVITGSHEEVLPIPASCAYNRFLPGQRHSFGGKRFEIIGMESGRITVRNEETVEREKEYTQIIEIPYARLEDIPEKVWKSKDLYGRELYKGTVTRTVKEYFSHINGLDFKGYNTERLDVDAPIEEKKDVYCLRIRLSAPFGEKYNEIAALFVVLFRGILETALPKNYEDVIVVSPFKENAFNEELFDKDDPKHPALRRDPIPSDWLESKYDKDLPLNPDIKKLFPKCGNTNFKENCKNEINIYLVDFGENNVHIMTAIAEETTRYLRVMHGYLDWVNHEPELDHCYIRFGYKQIPRIFALTETCSYLENVLKFAPIVSGGAGRDPSNFEVSGGDRCSFCGRPITVSSWKFDDDRIMCEDCHQHITTARKEITELLAKAYQTLEKTYDITLPKGIKVKFKSASSIRKKNGSSGGGRVLGFYSLRHREIWVERGGPAPCVLSTLMHELTHAWQHANIEIDSHPLLIIEGHSTYVEIECSRLLKQSVYADFWERSVLSRGEDDVYAEGLRYWNNRMKTESEKNIFRIIERM